MLYSVTLFTCYFSSLLHPNHLCSTFISFELNRVFIQSGVFIWTWKSAMALLYMKNGCALLSSAAFAFCCFLMTASFSPGGHADVNATLTASSTRRTFQSTITTENQTFKSHGQPLLHALPVTLQHGYHCHFLSYRHFKHCLLLSDNKSDLNNDVKCRLPPTAVLNS